MKRAIALCLVLLPGCLMARPKTDTIMLVNGNRISGEILSMSRSYLSISTDSMSTVNVKWPDVTRVASEFSYVVEDSQGRRYYGPLSSDADRVLQITDSIRGVYKVAMTSVISIYPSSRTVWRRFDGSLDAGYSFAKSSSRSQFNLSGDVRYRSIQWESQLEVESLVANSNGNTDTDRDTVSLTGLRHLGARWHLFSIAQYQHNLELGLSYRNSILGGVARRLIQTDRTVLSAFAGAAYSRENYAGTPAQDNGEGGLGIRYQFYKLYSPRVDISTQFILTPSLTVGGRVRSEFQAESRIELIKDFFWSLSIYDSYDSKPPGVLEQKRDYGVTTSVGWTFG